VFHDTRGEEAGKLDIPIRSDQDIEWTEITDTQRIDGCDGVYRSRPRRTGKFVDSPDLLARQAIERDLGADQEGPFGKLAGQRQHLLQVLGQQTARVRYLVESVLQVLR
jgi:hypothetical protein